MAGIGWVDGLLLGVLGASVLVGVWRGLAFELMALGGWVVAYVVARQWSAEWVAPRLGGPWFSGPASADPLPTLAAAFALTFVAVLVAWGLLARLVRALVHATPLTLLDRLLGGGFGLLRGGLLLLAVAAGVMLSPAAAAPAWQSSQAAAWLVAVMQGLKPVLPDVLVRRLP